VPVRSNPDLFAGVTQRIAVSGDAEHLTYRLRSGGTGTVVVHLRPRAGVCRVVLDVSPARRPAGDVRTLGVLAGGFEYVPAAG
jgi:hypothetical protein